MNQLTSKILLAVLLATSSAGVAVAAAPSASKAPAMKLDANGDGFVDRKEAEVHPRLLARFAGADKDRDGKLSREELTSARHAGMRHGRHGDRGGRGSRDPRHGGFMMMGMDADKDGRISAAEARAHFEKMDVNKDGFIDRADHQARAEQRRSEWFASADTDKDGKLSQAELTAAREQKGSRRSGGERPRGPVAPGAPAAK
jgi:Ca2+-binding EF-hand superfamily protein